MGLFVELHERTNHSASCSDASSRESLVGKRSLLGSVWLSVRLLSSSGNDLLPAMGMLA
jgi:hypothetical protein